MYRKFNRLSYKQQQNSGTGKQEPTYVVLVNNQPSDSPYRQTEEERDANMNFVETFRAANVILAGDLNMPNAKWANYNSTDNYDERILEGRLNWILSRQ